MNNYQLLAFVTYVTKSVTNAFILFSPSKINVFNVKILNYIPGLDTQFSASRFIGHVVYFVLHMTTGEGEQWSQSKL
jgi:hypothetical protein